jgi:hypothetical protein
MTFFSFPFRGIILCFGTMFALRASDADFDSDVHCGLQ